MSSHNKEKIDSLERLISRKVEEQSEYALAICKGGTFSQLEMYTKIVKQLSDEMIEVRREINRLKN